MKEKIKSFFIATVSAIVLTNCETKEPVSCYLPSVSVTNNSPLTPGATLKLSIPGEDESSANYVWTGPNGFESHEKNPVITDVTAAMAGEYKVKVKKGICESQLSSTVVEIEDINIPCNPSDNTLAFSTNTLSKVNFTVMKTFLNADNFCFGAYNNSNDLVIKFAGTSTPLAGVYTVTDDYFPSVQNEVYVYMNYYGAADYAKPGANVYVSYVNNKLVVSFCDLIFHPEAYSFDLNASAKIIEP